MHIIWRVFHASSEDEEESPKNKASRPIYISARSCDIIIYSGQYVVHFFFLGKKLEATVVHFNYVISKYVGYI